MLIRQKMRNFIALWVNPTYELEKSLFHRFQLVTLTNFEVYKLWRTKELMLICHWPKSTNT